MSFPSIIVLKNAAATNENFIRMTNDTSKVTYALESATLQLPVLLTVAHTMTTAREGSDRHLVKLARTAADVDGKASTLVVNCSASVPRQGITEVHIDDTVAELMSFFTPDNLKRWIRGEL